MPVEELANLCDGGRRQQEIAAQLGVLSTEIEYNLGRLLALNHNAAELGPLIEHAEDPSARGTARRPRPIPPLGRRTGELGPNFLNFGRIVPCAPCKVRRRCKRARFFEGSQPHRRDSEPLCGRRSRHPPRNHVADHARR